MRITPATTTAAQPDAAIAAATIGRVVTVMDSAFGALGNDVADDTVAIQAALDSGAKDVYVPAGTYKVTAPIVVPNNVHFYGAGETSVLKGYSVSGGILELAAGAGAGTRVSVSGFLLSGTATYGLRADGATASVFDNLRVNATVTDAFYFLNTFGCTYSNLWTHGATVSHACFNCGSNFAANKCHNWYASNFAQYNFYFNGGDPFVIAGNSFDCLTAQGGNVGFYVGAGVMNCTFESPYTENVCRPFVFGNYATLAMARGITITGAVLGGPLPEHPDYANRVAAVDFNYAYACVFYGTSVEASYLFLNAATVTIAGNGSGTGARAVARTTPAGLLHSVEVTEPGSGYNDVPTATITTGPGAVGTGSGATVSVAKSGATIGSISVTAAGTGYGAAGLPILVYTTCAGCGFRDVFVNTKDGIYSDWWPAVVRSTTADSGAGILMECPNGTAAEVSPMNMQKVNGYGWVHFRYWRDAAGVEQKAAYVPPAYP